MSRFTKNKIQHKRQHGLPFLSTFDMFFHEYMNIRPTQPPGRWGLWEAGLFTGLWPAPGFHKSTGQRRKSEGRTGLRSRLCYEIAAIAKSAESGYEKIAAI